MPVSVAQFTQAYLLWFILPLWLLAGVVDWLCHRRTHIERNAGPKESALHLLMLAEVGVPLLAALLLRINALVIVLMLAGFVLHEITAMWDVRYAESRREVTPFEQHVHSFLEILPLASMSFVIVLHWTQALALLGLGPGRADFSMHWKSPPLPIGYLAGLLLAVVLFALLPYLEEAWRGIAWRRARLIAPGVPRLACGERDARDIGDMRQPGKEIE